MQVIGKFRYKQLSIFPEEDGILVYYPYWVVYRNSKGKTTFDVWDALNGAKEGNQIKKAVAIGLEGQDGRDTKKLESGGWKDPFL